MAINTWQVNGVYLPRNPADFDFKPAKANTSYVDMLDGSVRRQRLARKVGSRQVKLIWPAVDAVVKRQILAAFVPDTLNVITLGGVLPARTFSMWYDDFDAPFVKEGYEPRAGFGGFREDLTVTGQSPDAWFSSVTAVPLGYGNGYNTAGGGAVYSTPVDGGGGHSYSDFGTMQSVVNNFLGPSGSAADGLPIWTNGVTTGQAWTRRIADTMAGADQVFYFQNLGDAEWLPQIQFNNKIVPVTAMNWIMNIAIDVDGTGGGVDFVWYGNNLGNGDSLVFNTKTLRAYLNGTETMAFNVLAHTTQTPFAYWPGMPSGTTKITLKNIQTASVPGSDPNVSSIDLSHGGTEVFRYV